MFQQTQQIIEKTEGYLLGLPSNNSLWSLVTRYIVFPFKFLKLGVHEFFKPFSLWAFVVFILIISASFLMQKLNIDKQYYLAIMNFCICAPMGFVIFAIPSTYCYYGVNKNHVNEIVKFLEQESINTIDEVKLLEENIEKIYARILSRVSFYRWLIGSAWAVYVLILNIEIRIITKVQIPGWEQELKENIFYWVIFIFITLVTLVLVIGYKRASEVLFKSIEFSCVEHKYGLVKKA